MNSRKVDGEGELFEKSQFYWIIAHTDNNDLGNLGWSVQVQPIVSVRNPKYILNHP